MPINRPYVAPYSAEFRHQAVLLTRSRNVPVSHVARELGISIDSLRDWIAQARHDPRQLHQLHEGTSETVQAELVRLRADNRLLREIAILRDALRIVASEGISAERGRRWPSRPALATRATRATRRISPHHSGSRPSPGWRHAGQSPPSARPWVS